MPHERPVRKLEPLTVNFGRPAFCCKEAERFSAWVDTLIARLTKDGAREPTIEQMWEAKAKLLDEYRKERNGAEKSHRDRLEGDDGERCIYGVFLDAVDRLADITIQPKITTPTRPAKPQPVADPAPPPKRHESVADVLAETLLRGSRGGE